MPATTLRQGLHPPLRPRPGGGGGGCRSRRVGGKGPSFSSRRMERTRRWRRIMVAAWTALPNN
eukprot:3446320-Pyramimonas_sp.AAC.1